MAREPKTTPVVKVMQTEQVGGKVVLEGETFDEAYGHARRLEQTTLDDMRKELALVRQQIEIERSVYAATADFMKKLAGRLQEESIRWSQRHDDDLNNRERDLEVGGSAAVSVVRDVLVSSVRRRLSFRLCRV